MDIQEKILELRKRYYEDHTQLSILEIQYIWFNNLQQKKGILEPIIVQSTDLNEFDHRIFENYMEDFRQKTSEQIDIMAVILRRDNSNTFYRLNPEQVVRFFTIIGEALKKDKKFRESFVLENKGNFQEIIALLKIIKEKPEFKKEGIVPGTNAVKLMQLYAKFVEEEYSSHFREISRIKNEIEQNNLNQESILDSLYEPSEMFSNARQKGVTAISEISMMYKKEIRNNESKLDKLSVEIEKERNRFTGFNLKFLVMVDYLNRMILQISAKKEKV